MEIENKESKLYCNRMKEVNLNLKEETYSDHLRNMLHKMWKSNQLTDVTLVCDDKKQLKAHKNVLSACSSVFKSIINDLPQNNSVIYLRGIQHQEMESILEFMYSGVAKFHQNRMAEFLNVAKNLEINEINKNIVFEDENIVKNNKHDYKELPIDQSLNTSEIIHRDENVVEKVYENRSDYKELANVPNYMENQQEVVKLVWYTCNQCGKQYNQNNHLKTHIKSAHEGLKYSCNHCEKQFTRKNSLNVHVQSVHEGVKYPCNKCDYRAARKKIVRRHIETIHG